MENVATFAGQTITVGMVISFVTEILKGKLPERLQNALVLRLIVAGLCMALVAASDVLSGQPAGWATLVEAFFTYLMATATHDHVLR